MAKFGFGFVQAVEPEEKVETWVKTIGSTRVIFTEHKKKGGVFLYNCTCESTPNQSSRPWPTLVRSVRLEREQVESLFPTDQILQAEHG